MDFLPHTREDWREMLKTIGVSNFREILDQILPKDLKPCRYQLDSGLSELEVIELLKSKAGKNATAESYDFFIGAGAYHHFIPSVVSRLTGRGEFLTAYTPYQPETSQGTLQAIFEYQTMMARLTGLEVSNASLYDGATASAEAAFMALAIRNESNRILVSQTVHPEYREVLKTYLKSDLGCVVEIPRKNGSTDLDQLRNELKKGAAALLVQWPNFLGCLEDLELLGKMAHEHQALLIVSTYPIALGLLKAPGDFGADICVGEGQSLGNPLQYGGPYFGFITCRKEYVRKMPGRIVGMTKDVEGKRGFVLTLQAREQHIRREKATSNICSNEALNALSAAIFMAVYGSDGFRQLAEQNMKKAHYAAKLFSNSKKFSLVFKEPFFNEFVLRLPKKAEFFLDRMKERRIVPGLSLRPFYSDLEDAILVCVTETASRAKIENFVECMEEVAGE